MSHAQRPRQVTVARSTNLMVNQKNKGQRTRKRNQPRTGGGRPYMTTTRTTDEVRTGMGGSRASIRATPGGGLLIKNSSILAVYQTETASRATAFGVNPASVFQFPWLSNIVKCYGQYRWKKLRFLWQSTTGTGVAGDVEVGVVYDLEEVRAYINNVTGATARMQAVAASRDVMSGPVWGSRCQTINGRMVADIMTDVDVSAAHRRFNWFLVNQYVADTTEVAEDNMAVGVYLIGHLGGNGSFVGNAGVLWVDYEIEVTGPVSANLNIPSVTASRTMSPWPPIYPDDGPSPPETHQDPSPVRGDAGVSGPDREVQA